MSAFSLKSPDAETAERPYWLLNHARTILFFTIVLAIAGVYLATKIPISVFPETNFPRVVIKIDNGVMPVEQMQVTITRPIELAVRWCRGWRRCAPTPAAAPPKSACSSTGTWTCSRRCNWWMRRWPRCSRSLPPTAQIRAKRLTFATFPILGYSLTSDTVSQTALWEMATYDLKPPLNHPTECSKVRCRAARFRSITLFPTRRGCWPRA